jgi:hypothetical protein
MLNIVGYEDNTPATAIDGVDKDLSACDFAWNEEAILRHPIY